MLIAPAPVAMPTINPYAVAQAAMEAAKAQTEQDRAKLLEDCRSEIQKELSSVQATVTEQLAAQAKEHTEVLQRAAEARTAAVKVR